MNVHISESYFCYSLFVRFEFGEAHSLKILAHTNSYFMQATFCKIY
jgi:hypothetical protein